MHNFLTYFLLPFVIVFAYCQLSNQCQEHRFGEYLLSTNKLIVVFSLILLIKPSVYPVFLMALGLYTLSYSCFYAVLLLNSRKKEV